MLTVSWFMVLAAALFSIGVAGVLIRRNALVMFMSIELMLNSVNLTFVAVSKELGLIEGQVAAMFVMVVAAAEVAGPGPADGEELEAQHVHDADSRLSKEVIADSGYYVGIGLYNLFQILNPRLIVLGGGLTNWGDYYLDKIKATFHSLARDMIHDPMEITLSEIIGDAGVIGAAALTIK